MMRKPDQFILLNRTALPGLEFPAPADHSDPLDNPDHKDFPDPAVKLENPDNLVHQVHVVYQALWDHQVWMEMTV